ncbi:DUF5993 family protein [Thiocapsa roseopersicina]|uniref:Uncharacterized protein n=1 Tax=Thiocapsa roseopersicina TaxID=1058 RepID=A0A1H3CKH1_THIRO|nr:DUF5993 family protein [Thiocapsa roseopersicina]SDX54653.1 hypothetical protein SAMN05421783_13516 [Thiocapsa roseopersicina]
MMVLPFALVTLALGALFLRRRRIALALWGLALLSLLWLFHLHTNDPLLLSF